MGLIKITVGLGCLLVAWGYNRLQRPYGPKLAREI